MSENILPIGLVSSKRININGNDASKSRSTPSMKLKKPIPNETEAPEPEPPEPASVVVGRSFTRQYGRQAWTMVALVFITNFLVLGFFKSLGILTKILNKEFVDSTMQVYIVMCIIHSLNCVAGPLACFLIRIYSPRLMALIGTTLVSVGLISSYFAKSLPFLYFSIGVFCGLGSGFTYPTGVILVGNYFAGTKRAAFANAIVVSGSPIGGMLMPSVFSWLSEKYTLRGTFLIVGVVMCVAILCAESFKSADQSQRGRDIASEEIRVTEQVDLSVAVGASKSIPEAEKLGETEHEMTTVDNNENVLENQEKAKPSLMNLLSTSGVLKIFEREDEDEFSRRMFTDASIESFCESGHHHHQLHPDQPLAFPISSKIGSGTKSVFLSGTGQTIHDRGGGGQDTNTNIYLRPFGNKKEDFRGRMVVGSFPGLECLREPSNVNNNIGVFSDNEMVCHYLNNDNENVVVARTAEISENLRVRKSSLIARPKPLQTTSHPYVLALDHSCMILCSNSELKSGLQTHSHSVRHEHKPNQLECIGEGDECNDDAENAASDGDQEKGLKNWILKSPLSNKTYVLLLISNISTAISTTNIHLMISQLVEEDTENDYTKSSMVYLIMAFSDLSGRLLGAFLTAKEVISPSLIYGAGLITAGISSSFFATYSSFTKLCLGTLAFGISSGLHVGIFGLLLTRAIGIEKIHVGYGLSMFLTGTLQCISILLSGRTISKYKNSFTWLAPLLGAVLVVGGTLWMLALLFCRRSASNPCRSARENGESQCSESTRESSNS